jgi:hypothetical protein
LRRHCYGKPELEFVALGGVYSFASGLGLLTTLLLKIDSSLLRHLHERSGWGINEDENY